ncbi:hypothetical protein [Geobacter sp. FeAm09]|uniref:hypothetical protein n=1 Tax=Geobacter sp. FeAm09 TaxID=2597769 RepID=UPI00197A724F|nr:hypothetical protein [Geobacter sp. FeAm09]
MVVIPSIITAAAIPATPSSLLLISLILPIMWLFGAYAPSPISRTNKKIYTIRFVFFRWIFVQKMMQVKKIVFVLHKINFVISKYRDERGVVPFEHAPGNGCRQLARPLPLAYFPFMCKIPLSAATPLSSLRTEHVPAG